MQIGSIIKTYTLKKWPKFSIFFSKKCLRMFGGFLKGKKLIKNRKSDFICLIFCISQTYKSMNLFNYKYIYLEKVAKVLKKNSKKNPGQRYVTMKWYFQPKYNTWEGPK